MIFCIMVSIYVEVGFKVIEVKYFKVFEELTNPLRRILGPMLEMYLANTILNKMKTVFQI